MLRTNQRIFVQGVHGQEHEKTEQNEEKTINIFLPFICSCLENMNQHIYTKRNKGIIKSQQNELLKLTF